MFAGLRKTVISVVGAEHEVTSGVDVGSCTLLMYVRSDTQNQSSLSELFDFVFQKNPSIRYTRHHLHSIIERLRLSEVFIRETSSNCLPRHTCSLLFSLIFRTQLLCATVINYEVLISCEIFVSILIWTTWFFRAVMM